MEGKKTRTSKIQKQILMCLVSGIKNGHMSAKSTTLNIAVSKQLRVAVHPNNFRNSCKLLQERGLIMRSKQGFDWFINITPKGIDFLEDI